MRPSTVGARARWLRVGSVATKTPTFRPAAAAVTTIFTCGGCVPVLSEPLRSASHAFPSYPNC